MGGRRVPEGAVLLGTFLLDIGLWWNHAYMTHPWGLQSLKVVAVAAAGYLVLHWRHRAPELAFGAFCLISLAVPFILRVRYYVPTQGVWLGMFSVVSRRTGPRAWLAPIAAGIPLYATVHATVQSAARGGDPDRAVFVLFTVIVGAVTAVVWLLARRQQARGQARPADARTDESCLLVRRSSASRSR